MAMGGVREEGQAKKGSFCWWSKYDKDYNVYIVSNQISAFARHQLDF